ncbi:MAG: hypothetical protein ACFFD6_11450 [Candidatus Thorarchaeota archaeon]
MSNDESTEQIDDVLEILANPLSRYILSVLAGVDPGAYTGPLEGTPNEEELDEDSDS